MLALFASTLSCNLLPLSLAIKFIPPIERDIIVDGQTRKGYVLEWESDWGGVSTFESVAESGGRPVALKYNETNVILEVPTGPSNVWGSSFWPSPQSLWGWPPPVAFDEATYTASVDESAMTVTFVG